MPTLMQALQDRCRRSGGGPLLIHYDVELGSRIELSAITFANWVFKTANLIEDIGAEPGDVLWAPLLTSHPGHWVGAVWTVAARLAGLTVVVERPRSGDPAITVTGPAGTGSPPYGTPAGAGTVVACSLHPLGLGFPGDVPGDLDYAEVLAQPDDYYAAHDAEPAGLDGEPLDDRVALAPASPDDLAGVLLPRLLGTGGVVVVASGTPDDLVRIAAAERATPLAT
jgi:uncharacterized protein (TIGR03089 family)